MRLTDKLIKTYNWSPCIPSPPTLSQGGRLLVMMMIGSWSCLFTFAVILLLANSDNGTMFLNKKLINDNNLPVVI